MICHFSGTVDPPLTVFNAPGFTGCSRPAPRSKLTVTVNAFAAEFEWASPAWHDTLVVPAAKVAPDDGVHVTGTVPSTMSDADAVNDTGVPADDVAVRLRLPGTVSVGAVVSCTVTVNE